MWNYIEEGTGRTLILLHPIGLSHAAWKAVMPFLSQERHVIAFDTAGFGNTPPLPEGVVPTVPNLVNALAESLIQLGITTPVDIVGNSLGGYMALEAAKRGLARSVVAISPAGLWKEHPSFHVKYFFWGLRRMAQDFPFIARPFLKSPIMREVFLAVPVSLGSRHIPTSDAIRMMEDFAHAPAFDDTFLNAQSFTGGKSISIPVTIAFGCHDWLLPKTSQLRDELPPHTKWVRPRGWGHVPMWVDPLGVSRLILENTFSQGDEFHASSGTWRNRAANAHVMISGSYLDKNPDSSKSI
jgi:pimeloyl-ACP methyl ester carboxylesterase